MPIAFRKAAVITLFVLRCWPALSQQPGGISGTKLWYVTNRINKSYSLVDTSGHHYAAMGAGTAISFNFHTALYCRGGLSVDFENFAFNQATVIGVFFPDSQKTNYANKDFLRIEYNGKKTVLRYNSMILNGITRYQYGSPSLRTNFEIDRKYTMPGDAMKIAAYYQSTRELYTSVWGEDKRTKLSSDFKGYLPELIIYNRVITPLERWKIESYLAIKYGLTLDTSYIGSNGKLLWDIRNPQIRQYHHRVCAIGRSANSALWQPKSNTSYEEQPYNSYAHGSDEIGRMENGSEFIPASDSPSLYRSLTIGYQDPTMSTIAEGSFLFWGDDSQSVDKKEFYQIDSINYPGMETVARNWMMYNRDGIAVATKIVIAGKDYDDRVLFSNLYQPFDYQRFRYMLIKLKKTGSRQIDTAILCSYFGREQDDESHFRTRTIVWEDVAWKSAAPYTVFTIGRAPVLSILEIGKKGNLEDPGYPFIDSLPIVAATVYDTIRYKFSASEAAVVRMKISSGVPPLTPFLFQIVQGTQKPVANAFTRLKPDGGAVPEIPAEPEEKNGSESDNDDERTEVVHRIFDTAPGKIDYIEHQEPLQRKNAVSYELKLPNLNATYIVVIKDKVGQILSIPIRIVQQ